MIENSVYQLLSNIDGLAAYISDRIYYQFNPNQEETQYLIYQKLSHSRPLNIDGSAGIESPDFQIDIYSDSEDTVRNIRELLVNGLHGGSNEDYSENIQLMLIDSEFSGFEAESNNYRITLTVSLFFK